MSARLLFSACAALGLLACSGETNPPDDTVARDTMDAVDTVDTVAETGSEDTAADTTVTDDTPPELDDVRATLGAGVLDLSQGDAVRVLTTAMPITFKVSAYDAETDAEALTVEVLDTGTGAAVNDQDATFHNGLWEVTTTADLGLTLEVRVTDEAGNATVWPHAAVFPTRAEALVRDWTRLVYGGDTTVSAQQHAAFTDGVWCVEAGGGSGGPYGGSWEVLGDGRLVIARRHEQACELADHGTEWDSVEERRTADFYVSATYFSERPYARVGEGDDLVGTWVHEAEVDRGGGAQTVTASLTLEEDRSFAWTREDGSSTAGTYEIRENSDYTADFGNLLLENVAEENGAAVTPYTVVHYWTIREGLLLVDPWVEVN